MISTRLGISLDVQHIAGERNTDADFLSRWDSISELPSSWNPDYRYRFSVADFFDQRHDVRLFPADAKLLWHASNLKCEQSSDCLSILRPKGGRLSRRDFCYHGHRCSSHLSVGRSGRFLHLCFWAVAVTYGPLSTQFTSAAATDW